MCVYLISTISYISNVAKVAGGNCIRINCQRGFVFPSTLRISSDQGAATATTKAGSRCSLEEKRSPTQPPCTSLSHDRHRLSFTKTFYIAHVSSYDCIFETTHSTLSSQILPKFAVIGRSEKTVSHRLCLMGVFSNHVLKTFGISTGVVYPKGVPECQPGTPGR